MPRAAPSPKRWYTPWRAAAHRSGSDPADMGTAYGLELRLTLLSGEDTPAPASPAAPSGEAAAPTGWIRRLATRKAAWRVPQSPAEPA